jgi:hypothetical protein
VLDDVVAGVGRRRRAWIGEVPQARDHPEGNRPIGLVTVTAAIQM